MILQFTLHTIEYSKPQYIRQIIKEFDDKLWHEDLQKKNSLILYREYKHVRHAEQEMMITQQQQLLYSGTLILNRERRHTDDIQIVKDNKYTLLGFSVLLFITG